jgi:uncharacterized OB-fold protein
MLSECEILARCEQCGSLKHYIRRCTKKKPHEFDARFVGSVAEGLVFFFLDVEEVDLQQNEKHNLALVLVLEGNVVIL